MQLLQFLLMITLLVLTLYSKVDDDEENDVLIYQQYDEVDDDDYDFLDDEVELEVLYIVHRQQLIDGSVIQLLYDYDEVIEQIDEIAVFEHYTLYDDDVDEVLLREVHIRDEIDEADDDELVLILQLEAELLDNDIEDDEVIQ